MLTLVLYLHRCNGDFNMLELCSGELFAGCKIVCVCGKGGYGTVYLAENATLLGGYWHNGKFFWSSSKNEIEENSVYQPAR